METSKDDQRRWLKAALDAAEKAEEVLLHYFGQLKQVREKPRAGLVSEADLESERVIREILRFHAPEVEFYGEESGGASEPWNSHAPCWVVDPLDGTTNFVHGVPAYCVSIGLVLNQEVRVGVVSVPPLQHRYHASRGEGAFKNNEPIRVSGRLTMQEALLATGFFRDEPEILQEQIRLFSDLVYRARGIRRIGAAAYDLSLVAEGVFDAFWERGLKPWDTCAGTLLVREAGGLVTDYTGANYSIEKSHVIAGAPVIHGCLLREFERVLSSKG